jgi:hypothetical protein
MAARARAYLVETVDATAKTLTAARGRRRRAARGGERRRATSWGWSAIAAARDRRWAGDWDAGGGEECGGLPSLLRRRAIWTSGSVGLLFVLRSRATAAECGMPARVRSHIYVSFSPGFYPFAPIVTSNHFNCLFLNERVRFDVTITNE